MRPRDGDTARLQDEAVPVHDVRGEPLLVPRAQHAITDRKQFEAALRRQSELLTICSG